MTTAIQALKQRNEMAMSASPLSTLLRPSFNELRKIKIGCCKPGTGNQTVKSPVKLDHFIITELGRGEDGNFVQATELMDSLKNQGYADSDGHLRRLPIYLLSNDIDEILQSRMVVRVGKVVHAHHNGRTLTLNVNPKTNEWLSAPVTVPLHPEDGDENDDIAQWVDRHNKAGNWKLNTRFTCMIPSPLSPYGGGFIFRTTGQISSGQLYSNLKTFFDATYGFLRGVPLEMLVRTVPVAPGGRATTAHVVHLQMMGSDLAMIRGAVLERIALEKQNRREVMLATRDYRQLLDGLKATDDEEELEGETIPALAESKPVAESSRGLSDPVKTASSNSPLADKAAEALAAAGVILASCGTSEEINKVWGKIPAYQQNEIANNKEAAAEWRRMKTLRVAELAPKTQTPSRVPDPVVNYDDFVKLADSRAQTWPNVLEFITAEVTGEGYDPSLAKWEHFDSDAKKAVVAWLQSMPERVPQ